MSRRTGKAVKLEGSRATDKMVQGTVVSGKKKMPQRGGGDPWQPKFPTER